MENPYMVACCPMRVLKSIMSYVQTTSHYPLAMMEAKTSFYWNRCTQKGAHFIPMQFGYYFIKAHVSGPRSGASFSRSLQAPSQSPRPLRLSLHAKHSHAARLSHSVDITPV